MWVIIAQSSKTRRCFTWGNLKYQQIFSINFMNVWLQVHIHLIFHERCSIFPAIYDCSKWKFCKSSMSMGMMKLFPFLLTFFHRLVSREGTLGTAASLIPYLQVTIKNRSANSYYFSKLLLCEEILRQGKHVHN